MKKVCLLLAVFLFWSAESYAIERNDIPSCYAATQLSKFRPALSGRELIVAIDATVDFPKELKDATFGQVMRYLQPGDQIRLFQFSANLGGNYLREPFTGLLEPSLSEKARNDIGMDSLRKIDICLKQQQQFFRKKLAQALVDSFGKSGSDIPKSEVLYSLKQIGNNLAADNKPAKSLLIVSDMLENSDFTSFYSNNKIRSIDAATELKKVEAKNLFTNLSGINVYVLGAGTITQADKKAYISGDQIQKLEAFWHQYFAKSNAQLGGFGTPYLSQDLQ